MKIHKVIITTVALLWAACLTVQAQGNAVTADKLGDAISHQFTNSPLKLPVDLSENEAGIISQDTKCLAAADEPGLSACLMARFKSDTVLKTNTDVTLQNVAGRVAAEVFGAAGAPAAVGSPPLDLIELSKAIVQYTRPWLPKSVDSKAINRQAGIVASACSAAKSSDTLYSALNSALLVDPVFKLAGNEAIIGRITSQVVLAIYPLPRGKNVKNAWKMQDPSPIPSWGLLSLWTGAKLLNPYTIDPTSKKINGSGSTSDTYIEVDLNMRYVTRSGLYSPSEDPDKVGGFYFVHFWEINDVQPDIASSFGYVFAGGNSTNSVSVSTVVGSSDIYGDVTLGVPLFRKCTSDFSWKQQVSLEINGGFATDKSFDVVHPTLFLGGGYQVKGPSFTGSSNSFLWFSRVGAAMIDQPDVSGDSVNVDNVGGLLVPVFKERWVPAVGMTIILPVSSGLNLQAGGNAYLSSAPASWNVTLGVSLDLTKFAKGLGTALGLSP